MIKGAPENIQLTDYDDATAYMRNDPYYITAAWAGENVTRVPLDYIVGSESVTYANGVKYVNAKLSAGSTYTIFIWIDLRSDIPVRALPLSFTGGSVLAYTSQGLKVVFIILLLFYAGRESQDTYTLHNCWNRYTHVQSYSKSL